MRSYSQFLRSRLRYNFRCRSIIQLPCIRQIVGDRISVVWSIRSQCTLSLPPENIRNRVFWCFQGLEKECIGEEWTKTTNVYCKMKTVLSCYNNRFNSDFASHWHFKSSLYFSPRLLLAGRILLIGSTNNQIVSNICKAIPVGLTFSWTFLIFIQQYMEFFSKLGAGVFQINQSKSRNHLPELSQSMLPLKLHLILQLPKLNTFPQVAEYWPQWKSSIVTALPLLFLSALHIFDCKFTL